MTPRLQRYQQQLGEPRRFTLVPPEPVHQPEYTQRWGKTQSAALVVVICVVMLVLGELATLFVGGGQ